MDQEPAVPKPSSKLTYIILGFLALAIIAVLGIFAFWQNNQQPDANEEAQQAEAQKVAEEHGVKLEEVEKEKLPERFPSDVPLEEGGKVVNNFNATTESGQFQASRVFESSRSLEENYRIYSNFLKSGGWEITKDINQPKLKALSGKKGNTILQVDINENSVTKVITVDIGYSELAK